MKPEEFDYLSAFTRNLGWLSEEEQVFLRSKRIAIAGLGGVGGIHLLTLVRLGFEQFHLADMDTFQLQNFNRQVGANLYTINKSKVDVLSQMAKDINPHIKITSFNEGIHQGNIDEFLSGVDLYVDGLDFFVLDVRAKVFQQAYDMNIPAITAGPLGMGTSYVVIMPGQMSFEKYFQFNGASLSELPMRFLVGLNPKLYNRHYLVDPNQVNFNLERGPSTIIACQLCGGVMGAEALKIVLNRGPIYALPRFHIFDPYLCKHRIGWMPFGNKNPIQKLKMHLMKKKVNPVLNEDPVSNLNEMREIEQILNLARWAPSGDNTQPWLFDILNNNQIRIKLVNEGDRNYYDFAGIPSIISGGCLLETIKIAASLYSQEVDYQIESESNDVLTLILNFRKSLKLPIDKLAYCITKRSVCRRNYKGLALSNVMKQELEISLGSDLQIIWLERFVEKILMSKINMLSTKLRMTMPELFPTHQRLFVSTRGKPKEGIPIAATGMNPIAQFVMKWAIQSWSRVTIVNKLGAVLSNQIELDLLRSLCCAAHFIIIPNPASQWNQTKENYLQLGAAIQRFWLTATRLGLVMQPTFAPIMLQYYCNKGMKISSLDSFENTSKKIANYLIELSKGSNTLFLGRIGYPKPESPKIRSNRKSLSELIIPRSD